MFSVVCLPSQPLRWSWIFAADRRGDFFFSPVFLWAFVNSGFLISENPVFQVSAKIQIPVTVPRAGADRFDPGGSAAACEKKSQPCRWFLSVHSLFDRIRSPQVHSSSNSSVSGLYRLLLRDRFGMLDRLGLASAMVSKCGGLLCSNGVSVK